MTAAGVDNCWEWYIKGLEGLAGRIERREGSPLPWMIRGAEVVLGEIEMLIRDESEAYPGPQWAERLRDLSLRLPSALSPRIIEVASAMEAMRK